MKDKIFTYYDVSKYYKLVNGHVFNIYLHSIWDKYAQFVYNM